MQYLLLVLLNEKALSREAGRFRLFWGIGFLSNISV